MFWGCIISENTPCEISSNENCILNISNISLKYGPKDSKIKIHLSKEKNNKDIIVSTLIQNNKEQEKINLIINLSEDDIYNILLQEGKQKFI